LSGRLRVAKQSPPFAEFDFEDSAGPLRRNGERARYSGSGPTGAARRKGRQHRLSGGNEGMKKITITEQVRQHRLSGGNEGMKKITITEQVSVAPRLWAEIYQKVTC